MPDSENRAIRFLQVPLYCFVPSLLVAFAVLASADRAAAQNLLDNPDFDAPGGLSAWTTQTGTALLGGDSASCTSSGAVDATSGLSGGGDQTFAMTSDQCIQVDPGTTPVLLLAGMYRTTADVYARIYLQYFSDSACLAHIGFSSSVFGATSAAWNRIADFVPLNSGAGSVIVWADTILATSGGPQFTVQWDRFYLGVVPEIFRDDFEFEGGSACRWAPIVGGI